jgi:hypothetical protein
MTDRDKTLSTDDLAEIMREDMKNYQAVYRVFAIDEDGERFFEFPAPEIDRIDDVIGTYRDKQRAVEKKKEYEKKDPDNIAEIEESSPMFVHHFDS